MVVRVFFLLLLFPSSVWAAVFADIDRNQIDANETFNLYVRVDRVSGEEPDLEPLEKDFRVVNDTYSSNTEIRGGRVKQVKTFVYTLIPLRSGKLTIPPLQVDGERTKAMTVIVSELPEQDAEGADIFVVAELDRESTWVQAQVILKLKLYTAVTLRQQKLQDPKITGAEALVEKIGDDLSFDAVIDGRNYDVIERRYVMYPQQSGTINISEAVYSARVWENGRLSGQKYYYSKPLTLSIAPIPDRPLAYPDAAWLPAKKVELAERWNPSDRSVAAGEPLTRELQLMVEGLLAAQIPALPQTKSQKLKIYPDKPDLESIPSKNGVSSYRTERYALIAERGGTISLPDINVPWWNVETAAWEIANLPGATLDVELVDAPEASPVASVAVPPVDTGSQLNAVDSRWRIATAVVGALWLLTALAWWVSFRRRLSVKPRSVSTPSYVASRRLLKKARKAALANDSSNTARYLIQWGRQSLPSKPGNLAALASEFDGELSSQILKLEKTLYGAVETPADLSTLAAKLAKLDRVAKAKVTHDKPALASLTP